jgi:phospholipid/cholesterol/gamma-HCH transport system substrate-binding protein
MRTASDRFPSIAQNTDQMIQEARPAVRRLDDTMKEAQATMSDLRRISQPLSNSSERITHNLDEAADRFNKVMADVQALMQVINRQDGTVQRLLADPSVYNNLNEVICQVARMMPTLDRALKDIEVFTDKIARHPESLGVGGAVRPGSGIK